MLAISKVASQHALAAVLTRLHRSGISPEYLSFPVFKSEALKLYPEPQCLLNKIKQGSYHSLELQITVIDWVLKV